MDVRDLTAEQHDDAVALWHDVGLTRPWNDPHADLERAMNGPASTVLAGVVEGALVATVMVGHDGHRGWVYYLAVREEARRQGIGARMMRAAERWLRDRAAVKVQLMVRIDNDAVSGFYAALGYQPSEVRVLARWLEPGSTDQPPPAGGSR